MQIRRRIRQQNLKHGQSKKNQKETQTGRQKLPSHDEHTRRLTNWNKQLCAGTFRSRTSLRQTHDSNDMTDWLGWGPNEVNTFDWKQGLDSHSRLGVWFRGEAALGVTELWPTSVGLLTGLHSVDYERRSDGHQDRMDALARCGSDRLTRLTRIAHISNQRRVGGWCFCWTRVVDLFPVVVMQIHTCAWWRRFRCWVKSGQSSEGLRLGIFSISWQHTQSDRQGW